ncbi:unnamed protein product [Leptidea sinapis]|uniref:Transcription factor 25 n=1 Tax=Leptidea sinapis TaxID=189913 RepID=A0A5E4QLD5_9NEOP|nr:unnamed protein product [Leptidea sinapis]
MSSRHFRKFHDTNTLPPLEGNSDEEFEPYKLRAKSHPFQGLEVSSTSETADGEIELPSDDNDDDDHIKPLKKKKNNKKKYKKRNPPPQLKEDDDEVEKLVKEVNDLLGQPEVEKPPEPVKVVDRAAALFTVQQKFLDEDSEMERKYGDEYRKVQKKHNIKLEKNINVPFKHKISRLGFGMSIYERHPDYISFAFDHNTRKYRSMHENFLRQALYDNPGHPVHRDLSQVAFNDMHMETIIESTNCCFEEDNYIKAKETIETCIALMQYAAHPFFSLTCRRTRLPFSILENRPYHVALLVYAHIVSRRACHRTALEIAKVLMNIDPEDPLAALLIIDSFALGAQEYKWLWQAIEYWVDTKKGEDMFNLMYSRALACYHLSKKDKNFTEVQADKLLKLAMIKFPYMVMKIVDTKSLNFPPEIINSELFNSFADEKTPTITKELMLLYANYTDTSWTEARKWLVRNAKEVAISYEKNQTDKIQAIIWSERYLNLIRHWSKESLRHILIIIPMYDFLIDVDTMEVPELRPGDPVSGSYINRYNYPLLPCPMSDLLMHQFLRAIVPNVHSKPTESSSSPSVSNRRSEMNYF